MVQLKTLNAKITFISALNVILIQSHQGQLEDRAGSVYCPEITSAIIPNGVKRQLASLGSLQNKELWPDFCPSRSNSRSRDGLPDIAPNYVPDHADHLGTCETFLVSNTS